MSEDGRSYINDAKPMMDLERKIEERFGSGEDTAKHCITIAASTVPAQYLLPEILKRYNEKYPKEQLKIVEMDSAQVVLRVIDHMVDVGLTGTTLEKKAL